MGKLKTIGVSTLALGMLTGLPSFGQDVATGSDLVSLYKYLHANPELSLKEANTSALLAKELEALGFAVTTGLGDDWVREKAERDQGVVRDGVGGYGVVGVLENGEGPTLLIRADMDALPVPESTGFEFSSAVTSESWTGVNSPVMHACGHDIHMTSWVGTARELVEMKDEWSGTLVMILQPAEEVGLGAKAMLSDGLFEDFPVPDFNLALHVNAAMPAGSVGYVPGFAMANVDSVDIIVKGTGGHGAYPHTTVDPIVIASNIVMAVQTLVSRNVDPQKPAVVTVGSFTAGAKHNIIPDQVHLKLTVRSYGDDVRDLLLTGIERIANGQAASYGAPEPDIRIDADYTPATYNDPDLSDLVGAAMRSTLGADSVRELTPVMGGEDFSQYSRTEEDIPSVLFWVGAVNPETYEKSLTATLPLPSLHSPFFAPEYEKTIETGVKAMTASAMAILNKDD
ncbi:MAG: peptidase M20 [Ponticaulis sp.]|nr:peptidase M20 [Ponticaulis sp.]